MKLFQQKANIIGIKLNTRKYKSIYMENKWKLIVKILRKIYYLKRKKIFFLYYEKNRSRINLEKLNKKSLKSTVYIKCW